MLGWRRKIYAGWEVDYIKERKGQNYYLTLRMPDGSVYRSNYNAGSPWMSDAKRVAKRLIRQKMEWIRRDSEGHLVKKTVRF